MVRQKKTGRILALLIVLAMILPTQAFAIEERASSNIQYCVADLSPDQDGNLHIFFSIMASSTMDDIGASSIKVQRYSGSRWITEDTLVPRNFPEMEDSDADHLSFIIPYTPDYSGIYYRVVVSAYATNSSGTSTTSVTSRQIIA